MKKILGIASLICVSTAIILQPSLADQSDLQKRIQETLSRYEKVKGDEMYVDDSDMSGFDTKQAVQTVDALSSDIAGVVTEIESIQQQKKDNEQKYQAMLSQVKRVIIDINETKKTVSDAVMKMNIYNKDIADTIRSLQSTRSYVIEAKSSLSHLVELMYLVQNDFYGQGGASIDDIKLLLKSDNISSTLSADEIMNALVLQFDTLIEDLIDHQTKYTAQYQKYTELRAGYKKTVIAYEEKIQVLEEQKAYLMDFLKLYKSNKTVLDAEMNNLFQTRAQLKAKIATVVRTVRDYNTSQAFLNSENFQKFSALKDTREQRRNYFLWPVLPVSNIDTYFSLTGTDTDSFIGVKLQAKQMTPIYAPANGVVYQIADNDGMAVNWMMIVHNDGYVTVFTNINKTLVKQGDIVRRGQMIAQVG